MHYVPTNGKCCVCGIMIHERPDSLCWFWKLCCLHAMFSKASNNKYTQCVLTLSGLSMVVHAFANHTWRHQPHNHATCLHKCWMLMCEQLAAGHESWVLSVACHPSGNSFATGSSDSKVKLWDMSSRSCAQTLSEHSDQVWDLAFNVSGNRLASVSDDKNICLYDYQQWHQQSQAILLRAVVAWIWHFTYLNLCQCASAATGRCWFQAVAVQLRTSWAILLSKGCWISTHIASPAHIC